MQIAVVAAQAAIPAQAATATTARVTQLMELAAVAVAALQIAAVEVLVFGVRAPPGQKVAEASAALAALGVVTAATHPLQTFWVPRGRLAAGALREVILGPGLAVAVAVAFDG